MKKNIVVAGCGHWGKNLVRNFHELGSLKYISDPDEALVNKISDEYKIESIGFEEALEKESIKGVVVAAPAKLHSEMAIKAIKKGKNVFVEKPLAMNNNEAIEMINVARENNVHLMVGHLLQYHPIFIELKKIIDSGKLGKIKHIYSNRLSLGKIRSHENVVWSFAPHDISMILSLVNRSPIDIKVNKHSFLRDKIADIASISLDFGNNLKSNINISWINPFKEQKLVVICEDGSLIFDDTLPWEKKLCLLNYKIAINGEESCIEKSDPAYIKIDFEEPLKKECKYFIELIDNKVEPRTDGYEGLEVLKVLTATD